MASIGIPLVIDDLKGGSAVRIGNRGGTAPTIGRSPPFIGTWEGSGKKKKKKKKEPNGRWSVTRKEQSIQKHSFGGSNIIKPKFHRDIPMSNFDLLDWCKY